MACVLVIAALVLLDASFATAQGLGGAKPADVHEDVVYAVDPSAMTITLGDQVYQVTEKSRLLDATGRRTSLSTIDLDAMVEFTFRPAKKRGLPSIRKLQVRDGDYE